MPKLCPKSLIPSISVAGSSFLPFLRKSALTHCNRLRKCLENYSKIGIFYGSGSQKRPYLRKWRFLDNFALHPTWGFRIQNGQKVTEMNGSVAEVTPPHPLAVTSATALEARSGSVTTKIRAAL